MPDRGYAPSLLLGETAKAQELAATRATVTAVIAVLKEAAEGPDLLTSAVSLRRWLRCLQHRGCVSAVGYLLAGIAVARGAGVMLDVIRILRWNSA